jgi:hypothetical protein
MLFHRNLFHLVFIFLLTTVAPIFFSFQRQTIDQKLIKKPFCFSEYPLQLFMPVIAVSNLVFNKTIGTSANAVTATKKN